MNTSNHEIHFTSNNMQPEFLDLLDQMDHDLDCIRRSERLNPDDIILMNLRVKTGSRGMYRIDLLSEVPTKRLMRVERWENNRPSEKVIRVVTVAGSVIL